MDYQESEANKEFEMAVILPSTIPVVGCQINPDVRIKFKMTPTLQPLPPHSLDFTWYSEMVCSLHPSELATVQCMSCVNLKIPVSQSFYCSPMCFLDAWKTRVKSHRHAANKAKQTTTGGQQALRRLRSCGSWPDFSSDLLLGENALVVEREGKVWFKVGSSKTYEPSMDDVGFILRLECLAVDHGLNLEVIGNLSTSNPTLLMV